ncbi:MAG TPA: AAA family ATPase [Solirubrobacteraceae bacterium]|nr:AAA family ATPase [Solirubrobacteraceae bacterium]
MSARGGALGQERARHAIEQALAIRHPGYNVFATGPIGSGRQRTLEAHLRAAAAKAPVPEDVVYLPSFDAPERPTCARLPPGDARRLAGAVSAFVAEARRRIRAAFESESYQRRRAETLGPLERERHAILEQVRGHARSQGVQLELTPAGVVTIPIVDGKPVTPQQFALLPDDLQSAFQVARERVLAEVGQVIGRINEIDSRAQQQIDSLNRDVVLFAVGHLIDRIKDELGSTASIQGWLERVREDVIDNYAHFAGQAEDGMPASLASVAGRDPLLDRYAVNVFVCHEDEQGAPVVVERNPTFAGLFGRISYEIRLGATVTDHRHIEPGAIHRASGGYLLLHAGELFVRPFLWEQLKQVLRSGSASVENLADQYTIFPSSTLAPEAMAIDIKVVLIGSPLLHQLLYELDEDMRELFRVRADFDVEMTWDDERVGEYAAFVAEQVDALNLRHFGADAIAALVEQGARRAAHQRKLSSRPAEIMSLILEAESQADLDAAALVAAKHVHSALAARREQGSMVERKIDEAIAEGSLHIELSGLRVGQVNGLAVATSGDYSFGHPVRITASVAPGHGRVVSIERETKLSGQVHDKGFLTLRGYLERQYGQRMPLSLSASLAFEQSYGVIDGDSAAAAELCALLSSLAEVGVDQQLAITGSVDQHGRVQAVGGVNEKVEGFYRVCAQAGLTGGQGVIIPAANAAHLMLEEQLVTAVRAGRFGVWAVEGIDQALELLTGMPAGVRGDDGCFPDGSLHQLVDAKLGEMVARIRALGIGGTAIEEAAPVSDR